MAVVAGMFAFSCITDTTEDLGIQIDKGGVSEVTLSMEAARTHLGEKAGELYPLYWSEGDAIMANGVASNPLADIGASSASAVFNFNEEVSYPLCVVYPASVAAAAEEGEEVVPTTIYPVNFLATQPYTVGSFAPEAAPMYGYGELPAEGEEKKAIAMHHLTGVLRVAIKGDGEKVTGVKVLAENGKIAGPFTVDCATGEVIATEDAVNTVNVTFAEPLLLGAEATPIYLTIPAGNYGTFVITISTETHEKMTVKFNSDVRPIGAGVVREFNEFAYVANTSDSEEIFEIDSKEALIEFARRAATFYPCTTAKVVANIDMTGYDWTPIENFGAFTFDGGSAEGYTIKGLNAPLFGTTAATIQNVKLTDVAIVETERVHSGSIVCVLNGGKVENCSAAGTFVMNNTTFAGSTIANNYSDICIGGLVGVASAATVTNSINDVDITISSFCASTLKCKATAGGVVGGTNNSSSFSHLTNNGDISFESATQTHNTYISGIVGKESDASGQDGFAAFSDCENNGVITSAEKSSTSTACDLLFSGMTGTIRNADLVCENLINNGNYTHRGICGNFRASGLTSYNTAASFENCKNTGDFVIESSAQINKELHMQGLCGQTTSMESVTKCSNSGNMTLKSGATVKGSVYMVGLFRNITNANFSDNHNTGNLKVEGTNTEYKNVVKLCGIAETVSGAETVIDNCTNNGSLTAGAYTNAVKDNPGRLYMGGLFSNVSGGKISNCKNLEGGTITATPKSLAAELMISGIAAYASAGVSTTFSDCENKANITIKPEYANGLYVGGILGQVYSKTVAYVLTFERTKNSGNITIGGTSISYVETTADGETTVSAGQLVGVGGLVGYTLGTENNFKDCDNSGVITVNPTGNCHTFHVGGAVGYHQHRLDNYITTFDGCDNSGKIVYAPTNMVGKSYVGGFIGNAYGNTSYSKGQDIYNNCKVSSEVEISGSGTLTGNIFVGTFIGGLSQPAKMTSCSATDTSKLTISISKIKGQFCGAWIGTCTSLEAGALYDFTSCSNLATVNVPSKGVGAVFLSGFLGGNKQDVASPKSLVANVVDCKVGGSVNMTGKCGDIQYGGLCSYPFASGNSYKLTRFVNDCDFNFAGETTGSLQVGGIGAYISGAVTINECEISGDFNFSGKSGTYVSYGGCAQNANLSASVDNTIKNFTHSGNVTLTGTIATNILIGAFSAQQKTPYYAENVTNTGNITLGTADKPLTVGGTYIYIGGLFADIKPYTDRVYSLTGNMINTGNIVVQNTTLTEGGKCVCKVGGIVGNLTASDVIVGAKCYCKVSVTNIDHATVGYISGSPRTSATVKDCQLAGVDMVYDETDLIYRPTTLFEPANYYNYIYAGTTDWTGVEGYDGCSYLNSNPLEK